MRYIASLIGLIILVSFSYSSYAQEDISLEIELVNMMNSASVKYKYKGSCVKVLKSRKGNIFRLLSIKRVAKDKRIQLQQAIKELNKIYGSQDMIFADYGYLDGFSWIVKIELDKTTATYKVINCHNNYIDQIISLINKELRKKKRLYETGLMFKEKMPCE